MQLEELETAATEDVLTAGEAAEKASTVRAFTRRHPVPKPFPDHPLPGRRLRRNLPRGGRESGLWSRHLPPAPFHAIPRGWAGPSLIAMLVFEKYGQHQPLNRQAERFAREAIALSLSTLADLVGHATVALQPIHALIEAHVRAAHRLHGPSRQHAADLLP